jgi:hypothetical protein
VLLAVAATAAVDLAVLADRHHPAVRPAAAHSAPTPAVRPLPAVPAADLLLPTRSATPARPLDDRRAGPGRLPPDSVAIPRQHVVAPVGVCAIVDHALEPPADVRRTCRWAGGADMYDASSGFGAHGTTAVTGHINWAGQGTGALGRLAALHSGDVVLTSDDSGALTRWRVTAVTFRNKARGVDPAAFAGPVGPRVLYLISCGGAFDAGHLSYVDNIYVRAVPDISPQTNA